MEEYIGIVIKKIQSFEYYEPESLAKYVKKLAPHYYGQDIDPLVAAKVIDQTYNYHLKEQYDSLHRYQRSMSKRYKSATTWFEDKFPNLGYMDEGGFKGISVITKQFIKEFLHVYEQNQ